MNINKAIIDTFSFDQKKEFLTVLKKKNRRGDVKNIELFLLLSKENEKSSIDVALYGESNKGAYHAVSKRLHDTLIDFIAGDSFAKGNSKQMSVLKLLVASRVFFQQNSNALAFKTLQKAELKAQKYEMYHLLNEIYLLKIQNLHKSKLYDLLEVKIAFEKNKQQLQLEENLQLFYATIQDELENSSRNPKEILELNLKRYSISSSKGLHFASLIKIIEIFNTIAHVTGKHHELWRFIEEAVSELEKKSVDLERYLSEHIQLLFYLSNFNLRRRDFEESNNYLDAMAYHMNLKNGVYANKFVLKFKLLKALTTLFSGNIKSSLETLEDLPEKTSKNEDFYDLILTKVITLFFNGDVQKAYRIYAEFYHSDIWYAQKVGTVWVIQKNLIELLLLLELDNYDLFQSRLMSFRKKHKKTLLDQNEKRVLEFVKLISMYYKDNACVEKDSFKKRVAELINQDSKKEDIFILCFYAWLKSKINKNDVYATCLSLLE
ncbi:hypothetical protein [Flavicella sp.]|uniref:hypothetical protein n=1 Tax=Flavicella sp. TaxID=2957742 RepID=UPI00262426B3|nr:hypothetical protein [Flavicella sp.]MDG1803759.1 hypothetical protein [Flavicella sp.]